MANRDRRYLAESLHGRPHRSTPDDPKEVANRELVPA
jgi:hypothetical protein